MDKVLLIGEPMELLLAEEEGALADISHFRASVSGAEMNVAVKESPAPTVSATSIFGVFTKETFSRVKT